jgi:hypothetical protein
MKRIQVRPGKFVSISPALAEKAAALFAGANHAFTREQVLAMAHAEPLGATVFAGSVKPAAPAKRRLLITVARIK